MLVQSSGVEKVDDSGGSRGEETEQKAGCAIFGLDVIADDEEDAANGEGVREEGNDKEEVRREEGGQDELVDGAQDELLHGVVQNANWLVHQLLIARQWVASLGVAADEHDVHQSH